MNSRRHNNPEQAILFPALEQSMVAVVLLDEHDEICFFNQAAQRLWGYSLDEVRGRNVNILIPDALKLQHPLFIRHNRQSGTDTVIGMNREMQLQRKDGNIIWVSFVLSKAAMDGRVYYLTMARDVTAEVQRREQNQQLLQAMAHVDQPVLVFSPTSRIVQANKALEDMFGYREGEIIGSYSDALLFRDDDVRRRFSQLLRSESRTVDELQIMSRNGNMVWVRVCATPVSSARDQPCNRVLIFTDETEIQKIRSLEKEMLLVLADNQSFTITGETLCQKAEILLPGVRVSLYQQEHDSLQLWATGSNISSDLIDSPRGYCQAWSVRHNDNERAGLLVLTFLDECDCHSERFVERVAESCTWFGCLALEQEARRQQIEKLQQFDVMTGLPTRGRLHQFIDRLLSEPSACMAVFCLGVDKFNRVNEILGYAEADRILLAISERLREIIRPDQFLSRTEGAQFVIVAPGYDADEAARLAFELKDVVNIPLPSDGKENTISLSISTGISLWPGPADTRDRLLAAARNAMERLRDEGGNGWKFFDPEVNQYMVEEQLMAAALKKAIAENRLTLHYQPQIFVETGELYGVEALARWSDPSFGSVSPLRFIAVAEKMGLTGAFAHLVLQEACRQMADWQKRGFDIRHLSVNLSPSDFQDPELPAFIAALLAKYELPGECLTIEVTENAMMDLSDDIVARLNIIRASGAGLSVDDFGTGFSGLLTLAKLPVTEIKIDKSFIDGMTRENRALALTAAMTGIGHSLDLLIIAEGVETWAQLDLLRQLRCTVIQGYLFSPPLPAQQLERWISER